MTVVATTLSTTTKQKTSYFGLPKIARFVKRLKTVAAQFSTCTQNLGTCAFPSIKLKLYLKKIKRLKKYIRNIYKDTFKNKK